MKIYVVLVGTKYSRNIGACARALANMGGSQLLLIKPQCEVNIESYEAAAGAQKYLDNVQKFVNWKEYLKFYPHNLRIAFTARKGDQRQLQPWLNFSKTLNHDNLHFVFGPEDNGLSDSDLLQCNYPVSLPTYGEFTSLNLSQAVLLSLAIFQNQHNSQSESENKELKRLDDDLLKAWLLQLGLNLDAPKNNAFYKLKKYFNKSPLNPDEAILLEKVLHQTLRQLRSNNP
ncbi:MAG: RNA methyltransferase [Bdellovibrionales bacterium]|nr:RNA methyltransferase [Bdellovibrionales bacterium]